MTALDRLTLAVDELTRPRSMRQAYSYRDDHGTLINCENVVHVVSLLEQLEHTPLLETVGENHAVHAIPCSRPAGSLERLAALIDIRAEAMRLHAYMGGKKRPTLSGTLHGIVGQATNHDNDTQDHLAGTAGRWVSRAQSVTGWADPPWKPHNACPLCEAKHSLRVRVITATEIHASCVHCGEVWTPDTIGLLAEYVRWENGEHDLEEIA